MRRLQVAREQPQQRRLAGAVRADQHHDATRPHADVDAAQQRAAAGGIGEVARFQHVRQLPPTPRLTTMCRNTGAPISAITTPSGSSAGRTQHAREDVGQQHQRGAEQRAARQHDAMVGPGHQPDQVGNDDADEADHAGDRHRRPDRRRRDQDDGALGPVDVDAEMKRLRLAQQQAVQRPHQPRQRQHDQQRKRQHRQHLRPAGAGQAAQHPQASGRAARGRRWRRR